MEEHHNGTDFEGLMHALHRITRLQHQAASAQIDAREKRRKAGFKRRDVWVCDANFMKELQRLLAKEYLQGFDELRKLAGDCQETRNDLGPLEDEGIKAEQQFEAKILKLQQAEESLYRQFSKDFHSAETYSSGPPSTTSSSYQVESEVESQPPGGLTDHRSEILHEPPISTPSSGHAIELTNTQELLNLDDDLSQDTMLLGVQDMAELEILHRAPISESGNGDIDLDSEIWLQTPSTAASGHKSESPSTDILLGLHHDISQDPTVFVVRGPARLEAINTASTSVSGHRDIDLPLEFWTEGDLVPPPKLPPAPYQASLERYPALLTKFGTSRERIDNWILNSLLLSHLEATLLRNQLIFQISKSPSNWAQLVFAYWELDVGTPTKQNPKPYFSTER